MTGTSFRGAEVPFQSSQASWLPPGATGLELYGWGRRAYRHATEIVVMDRDVESCGHSPGSGTELGE